MSESKSTLGRPVTTRRSSGYRTVTSTAAGEDPSFRPAAPKSTRAAHRDNPEVASIRNIAPTLSRLMIELIMLCVAVPIAPRGAAYAMFASQ